MKTTSQGRSPLERRQSRTARGPAHPRIAERRLLRESLQRLIVDDDGAQHTPARTAWRWYDNTRAQHRCPLPGADAREMRHDAIQSGCTTRSRVVRHHIEQLADDLAQFPDAAEYPPADVLYVQAMIELAEAIEAGAIAHTMPSPDTLARAAKEGREGHLALELLCSAYERGHTIPFPSLS